MLTSSLPRACKERHNKDGQVPVARPKDVRQEVGGLRPRRVRPNHFRSVGPSGQVARHQRVQDPCVQSSAGSQVARPQRHLQESGS